MLIVNIIFKDKEIEWKFPDPAPGVLDLRKFIKTQYPDSLGATFTGREEKTKMPNFDFSNMTEAELIELAEQIQEEIENFKEKKLDKARQAFFKACDEVIEAGGQINYYGEFIGEANMYSMDKNYIYIT